MSKKWLNATFSSFHGFCLSHSLPAAKPAKYENPKVFIRSDVHAVRAGIKLKGLPPLNNPGFIDRLRWTEYRPPFLSQYTIPQSSFLSSVADQKDMPHLST